jgi:3-hydroxyacyl-CoA dehydrogenase
LADTVRLERRGSVAILIIDNPPVNALSHSVRVGLLERLPEIEAARGIEAIVLACAGSTFSAGADVKEFGAPPRDPIMAVAMEALERSPKITVGAIHGQALGGGLETALCFDYRCATPTAKLGLPEIKIGLFPGGGGTQRLPRLIGLPAALDMIIGGDPIDAKTAKRMGVIDEIVEGDLLDAAVAYAGRLVAEGAPKRRLSERPFVVPEGFSFADARKKAIRDNKGLTVAGVAIDALQAATDRRFAEGLEEERRLFLSIRNSVESNAMRHLFAAEREVAKIPGLPKDLVARPLETAAVFGAGTMGTGIAIALLNAGLPVTLIDTAQPAIDRSIGSIRSTFASQVERGRLSAAESEARLGRLTTGLDVSAAAGADIVIESVFEDMGVKQDLFRRLGQVAKPTAVLATNTSALDVDQIASASGRGESMVGMHFFSPANIMKLVEVIHARATAPEILATAMALCKRMGKIGVVSGVCDGFIGNRMLRGYRREAELLVLEGASPAQVDKVLTDFGMAMGVHAMGDMAGLDIAAAGRARMRAEGKLPDDPRLGAVQDRLVAEGRLGLKSGKGIYRYEPRARTPLPDPEVEALIEDEAKRLVVARRPIADEEIIARCIIPLANEGARILAEGVALGAADIDVVYCNGYGFPRRRGGPMFWADTEGLPRLVETIERFRRECLPIYWEPAPLLVELAQSGRKFADLTRGQAGR